LGVVISIMTFVPSIYRTMQRRRQPKRQVRTEQYRTYKHYQRGTEAARKYRGWVERKTTRDGRRGGGFEKFGRGAAMAPAGLIEYGSVIPIALESAVRKPKQTAKQALPGLVAGLKGTAAEAKKRPFEFGGEMVGQAILTYGIERGATAGGRQLTKLSPRYVSASKITPKRFYKPSPKGIPSTERVPIKTTPADIQKIFKTSPYTKGGTRVYHAAPTEWKLKPGTKYFEVQPGKSPTKGLYTGPEAYTPFAVRSVERAWKPSKTQPTPTVYRIATEGVDVPSVVPGLKSPKSALTGVSGRLKSAPQPKTAGEAFRSYKAFVESQTQTGKAYISPEAAAPVPWKGVLEVEAVIGKGAKLKPTGKPKFTYAKVPVIKRGKVVGREVVKIGVQDVELMKQPVVPTSISKPSIPSTLVKTAREARRGAVVQVPHRGLPLLTPVPTRRIEDLQREQRRQMANFGRVIDDITGRDTRDEKATRRAPVISTVIPRLREEPIISRRTSPVVRPKTKIVRTPQKQLIRRSPPITIKKPLTRTTKKQKKKYEEKLREFEEKAKEYDPEAWFEKHKIATIEELLGK